MGDITLLIITLVILYIFPSYLVRLWKALKVINITPAGTVLMIRPFRLLSEQMPTTPYSWISITSFQTWKSHFDVFESIGSSCILYLGLNDPTLQCLVADAEGSKLVLNNRRLFAKPVEDYGVLKVFGANVVASEGESWRRHRRLTGPSFSEKNNEQVWEDSRRVMEEWFAVLDESENADGMCEDSDTSLTTLRITLMIISSAAFGQQYSWPKPGTVEAPPPGRKIPYSTALQGAVEYTLARLILPKFVYKLPFLKTPTKVDLLFTELEGHFRDMITSRRNQKAGGVEHTDLFSALLKGVKDEEGTGVLTDEELLGNMYIFLLAGHETTAHTLAFALTLLALYPEHQEILYQEANDSFGTHTSNYSDYSSLLYTMATIHESLRMYPPVVFIPKVALEDTTVPATTTGPNPTRTEIFIPKGSRVGVMTSSLHYNPAYWKDPFTFQPARFIDKEGEEKWNRDAWAPFSGGGRGCLGLKFALVEMVVMISHLCLNFTIHVPKSLEEEYKLREGESERARRERILRPKTGITLTPKDLPLAFRRRKGL